MRKDLQEALDRAYEKYEQEIVERAKQLPKGIAFDFDPSGSLSEESRKKLREAGVHVKGDNKLTENYRLIDTQINFCLPKDEFFQGRKSAESYVERVQRLYEEGKLGCPIGLSDPNSLTCYSIFSPKCWKE